jgi:hypothetical protein
MYSMGATECPGLRNEARPPATTRLSSCTDFTAFAIALTMPR